LGQGQLIFEGKRKETVLVTWASKPEFKADKLRKLHVANSPWSYLIDAFAIEEQVEEGCLWYYSTVKKLDNAVKLYQLNVLGQELLGIPIGNRMHIPGRPAGISFGKYHGLVWTE
jgi:hypothetical protein